MPTENNEFGSLMWRDENGNWHPLGELQNIKATAEGISSNLYVTSLSDSEEVVIKGCGALSEEGVARLWAQAEGLEIIKRGE